MFPIELKSIPMRRKKIAKVRSNDFCSSEVGLTRRFFFAEVVSELGDFCCCLFRLVPTSQPIEMLCKNDVIRRLWVDYDCLYVDYDHYHLWNEDSVYRLYYIMNCVFRDLIRGRNQPREKIVGVGWMGPTWWEKKMLWSGEKNRDPAKKSRSWYWILIESCIHLS